MRNREHDPFPANKNEPPTSDHEKLQRAGGRGLRRQSTTPNPTPVDDPIDYPEGGRDAWLVVFGAFCGLAASLGLYNTVGVFEAVVSKDMLPNVSSSTTGWIFSVYAFVNWVCGMQIGPTFDAMGPRALILAGTVCTLIGIFSFSVCKGKAML